MPSNSDRADGPEAPVRKGGEVHALQSGRSVCGLTSQMLAAREIQRAHVPGREWRTSEV